MSHTAHASLPPEEFRMRALHKGSAHKLCTRIQESSAMRLCNGLWRRAPHKGSEVHVKTQKISPLRRRGTEEILQTAPNYSRKINSQGTLCVEPKTKVGEATAGKAVHARDPDTVKPNPDAIKPNLTNRAVAHSFQSFPEVNTSLGLKIGARIPFTVLRRNPPNPIRSQASRS